MSRNNRLTKISEELDQKNEEDQEDEIVDQFEHYDDNSPIASDSDNGRNDIQVTNNEWKIINTNQKK